MKVLLFLTLSVSLTSAVGAQAPTCQGIAGWQQEGPLRTFSADNLFEYMDGNAEGYLVYQFVSMNGVTCKNGTDTILIDVSEMADPEYAYGIFSSSRDPRQPIDKIGMGGQILPRRATLAKGKYYVEMAASPDKDQSVALRAFVMQMEERISGQSEPPQLLEWFPKENLVPDSVRLVPESVLGLRLLKRGYVGQYDFGKGFLVVETSPKDAEAVMRKLRERIIGATDVKVGEEAFAGTDKYLNGLCVFRKGKYLGGYANLKPGRDGSVEAAKLAANVRSTP
jgi:hypothetical protein